MKANTFIKGLFMMLIAFIGTSFATGFPATSVAWICLGITLLGNILSYSVQHIIWPSGSILNHISIADFIKGLGVSIATGLSDFVAHAITQTTMDWHTLWPLMSTVLIGFIVKTFKSDEQGQIALPGK